MELWYCTRDVSGPEMSTWLCFAGDLEKIVNLLLSLCSRLSRIDRSLLALERGELTQEDTAEERVRQDTPHLSDI